MYSHCFFLVFQYFDLAADVLAENAHLTYKFLTSVRHSNTVPCNLCTILCQRVIFTIEPSSKHPSQIAIMVNLRTVPTN